MITNQKQKIQIRTEEEALAYLDEIKSDRVDQKDIKNLLLRNILPHV